MLLTALHLEAAVLRLLLRSGPLRRGSLDSDRLAAFGANGLERDLALGPTGGGLLTFRHRAHQRLAFPSRFAPLLLLFAGTGLRFDRRLLFTPELVHHRLQPRGHPGSALLDELECF